ncbi:carbohydrate ABC transporter permease [Paenibacillus eucommiae]|uniref:Multiple sugar transport system permease protein n=1 Tax=Paenibacillus eucommiae TaxID=1355755 RepID=A0ABS4IRQ3_9BACL|nr:sugar ABC transporter permease [Paenibacillus eucommiae]MBP1990252.1 multiple sugar transport system permease protein [Paenibacillus eucommiae]
MSKLSISKKRGFRQAIEGYMFILPNLIGFLVFTLFSVIFSLTVSFTNWDLMTGLNHLKFIGLDNFVKMMKDPWFIDSMKNIFYFAAAVPFQIILALIIAVLINESVYFTKTFRTILFLPYVTNAVIIAIVWGMLLHPGDGIINNLLRLAGISDPPGWLGSSTWVKPAIILMSTWSGLGLNVILFLSGLVGISKEVYESAEIDGAKTFSKFFYITFPMISPSTFFIIITSVIGVFQAWSHIQILTGGGPGSSSTVIGYYIYKSAFEFGQMGYASAMAWVLFVSVFIFTIIQWRLQKRWVHY